MTNNDLLRRLAYTFDLDDDDVAALFSTDEERSERAQVRRWLRFEEDPEFAEVSDVLMARFLDAFIVSRRGPAPGSPRPPETRLNNNIVLRKLKIALNLHESDMLRLMKSGGREVGKPEMSALFRREGHKHYRVCGDDFVRTFMEGVQREFGPDVID